MLYRALLTSLLMTCCLVTTATVTRGDEPLWVTYKGDAGAGHGKKIVLISGDDEYRSEEGLPQLGKILATHHGFECAVLFPVNPETGLIQPDFQKNIPGLELLDEADLMILLTRFRDLPDEQMQHFVKYVESGKPIIALRTATHAFNLGQDSSYRKYDWRSRSWDGGFGRQVLGETWISHHGNHGSESTRGMIVKDQAHHPILTGIKDGEIWGPTDVYGVRLPLPGDSQPLLLGQVVAGMTAQDPAVEGEKNNPMMPIAWTKSFEGESGHVMRTFTTTMGASEDLLNPGLRRLVVNAVYWGLKMEDSIKPDFNVDIVGDYQPTRFGFGKYTQGIRPADHKE